MYTEILGAIALVLMVFAVFHDNSVLASLIKRSISR